MAYRAKVFCFMLAVVQAGAVAAAAPTSAKPADTPVHLSVVVFPGGHNWPLWVAQDQGFAAGNGVSLAFTETRDSVQQMTGLIEGRYDIAVTAFDNVVAYRDGLVAEKGGAPAMIAAFMGGDTGFLSLVVKPEIRTVPDLRGQALAVDSLTTGYAFALQALLAEGGLGQGDYRLVRTGGVKLRFDGLLNGDFTGTLLVTPLDRLAERRGFRRLADVSEQLGSYQGDVGAARVDWARRHRVSLIGYVAAYRQALRWLYDPVNKAAALALFVRHTPGAAEADAEGAYRVLVDPRSGLERDGRIVPAGMASVLALRKRFGPGAARLGPPSRYYVDGYYAGASRQIAADRKR